MCARYQCTLSAKTLAKAVEELREPENNDERLAAIDSLKAAFKAENPEIKLAQDDDRFFLRFLRARKFDEQRALTMITNYHVKASEWPEVFDKVRNPALISSTLDKGLVLPLKGKAKDGSAIVVGRPGLGGTTCVTDLYATIFLTMEKMVEDEETQIHGVTVIQDLAYFGMDYVKQINPSISRRFIGIVQDSLPLRVKSLNATNEPKIFDIVFAMAQPFMKEKIKKRYRLLGQDFAMLYEIIDKSVLPPMFAGHGPPLDAEEWKQNLFREESVL